VILVLGQRRATGQTLLRRVARTVSGLVGVELLGDRPRLQDLVGVDQDARHGRPAHRGLADL